ncbi:unnamed protein product [Alternaria alternata]
MVMVYAANSRVLNFASQAFAASVVTTLKTLCNGGLLVLPPERERMGGIANFITRKEITRTFLTPTLLNLLNPDEVSCLQFLTVGGEPVTQRLIDIWAPRLSLVEAIGMTEGVGIANAIDISGKKCGGAALHGQRFELGEVEKSMLDCLPPGVTVAAEVVEPKNGTGPMLVAFVHGLSTDFSHKVKQLRERLATILPDHMNIALATDWQAWCIGQGLLKSHGWHDYMIFKFPTALDVEKLVFVAQSRKTFQVILKPKAYPFHFAIIKASDGQNMDEIVKNTIENDIKRHTQLGDPLVAFTLVQNPAENTNQLVLRISHAQYDALSLDKLWRSLEALYLDKTLDVIPFTRFCAEASLATSKDSESFWKAALANSTMSEIRPQACPSIDYPINSAVKAIIPLVDLKTSGHTSATAVLASWSIVLSKLANKDSVVFGYITSGRHLPMPGVSDILGPCMNILPLRTDIVSTASTSSPPQLGSGRLPQVTSAWPSWALPNHRELYQLASVDARFSTVVNHLSFELVKPPFSRITDCEFSVYEPEHDKAELWLQTFARDDKLEVELRYSTKAFSEDWVKTVLDSFIKVYQQLPDALERPLSEALPQLNMVAPGEGSTSREELVKDCSIPATEYPKALEELVLSAWESVLGSDFRLHPGFTDKTPFYEIWGNSVATAAFASEYSKNGIHMSNEEILGCPSIADTIAHLSARMDRDTGKTS